MVLSRAKAFTDSIISGNGGGALVVPLFALEAPLRGTIPVHIWTCDDDSIGVVPSLEAPHLRVNYANVVVVVGWWCCQRTSVEEVHVAHVRREMQRAHGCWWS